MLKPIPIFPAYIRDQCAALWGIPASLEGETHKVKINVETAQGEPVPQSELDFFTLEGAIYLVHTRQLADGSSTIDYYRQAGTEIALDDAPPNPPAESRARLDSPQWLIESVIVNGNERSDLYNRNTTLAAMHGNPGPKGYGPNTRNAISAYVILDSGIVIMSERGAEYMAYGRLSVNAVSEPGRLWRLQ